MEKQAIKYTAAYMPASEDNDPSVTGFNTEDEAWKWIATRICKGCKETLNNKGVFESYKNPDGETITEWQEYTHPSHTLCGAEWYVLPVSDEDLELPDISDLKD